MLRIIVILAIMLLPQLLTAQPVLPGQDIVVWDTTEGVSYHGSPTIDLNAQGQCLVLFGSRAQWLDAAFSKIGNVIRLPMEQYPPFQHLRGTYCVAMTYPWFRYFTNYRTECPAVPLPKWNYLFYKHDQSGKPEFSDIIYSSFCCGDWLWSYCQRPIVDEQTTFGDQILFVHTVEGSSSAGVSWGYGVGSDLIAINKWTGESSLIRSSGESLGENIDRNTSAFPNMRISGVHGNEFLLRTQHALKVDTLITGVYSSCEIFDSNLQQVGNVIQLDTLSVAESRRSEKVVLTDNNIVFLYRGTDDDSVFADIFSRSGTRRNLGIFICSSPRFSVKSTENNSIIVLWDNKRTIEYRDISIRAFDESMNRLSDVKRVNSNTSGDNYAADFVLKGDTIIVCWEHQGANEYHAILGKRFTFNQVTPVDAVPQPAELAIRSIYPQPASEYAHFDVSMRNATGMATLTVYSILGVQVSQQQIQHDGIIQLDVHSMPRGLYYASLSDGVHESSRMFVVRR